MSNSTYFYPKQNLKISDEIGLSRESIYNLAEEIFQAWLKEQHLQIDKNGNEIDAILSRNNEGQSRRCTPRLLNLNRHPLRILLVGAEPLKGLYCLYQANPYFR